MKHSVHGSFLFLYGWWWWWLMTLLLFFFFFVFLYFWLHQNTDGDIAFSLLGILDLLFETRWPLYLKFKKFLNQCMLQPCPAYRVANKMESYSTDEWNMTLIFACVCCLLVCCWFVAVGLWWEEIKRNIFFFSRPWLCSSSSLLSFPSSPFWTCSCSFPNDCSEYEESDISWPSLFDSFGDLYWKQQCQGGESKN